MRRSTTKKVVKQFSLLQAANSTLLKAVKGKTAWVAVNPEHGSGDEQVYIPVKVLSMDTEEGGANVRCLVVPINGVGEFSIALGYLLTDLSSVNAQNDYDHKVKQAREEYKSVTTAWTHRRRLEQLTAFLSQLPTTTRKEVEEEADISGINIQRPSKSSVEEIVKTALRLKYSLTPDEYL